MATKSFYRLIMGKIAKWHLLPSHCRYFDKTFTEMFLEKSWIRHIILWPLLLFIGCHGNQNRKKIEPPPPPNPSSETKCSVGQRLCRNFLSYVPLQILCIFYENYLFAMATYIFHRLVMGKIEKWHLLPSRCRYFDKTSTEIFFE